MLMPPSTLVAFFAGAEDCPLSLRSSSTRDHQVPFHRAAAQTAEIPVFLDYVFPEQDHMYLSNLLLAHSFSLSRSSCRVGLPSEMSSFPLSFPPSANSARVHLIPSYSSLGKISNSAGPKINPHGTPPVTGCPFEELFTTTLWV